MNTSTKRKSYLGGLCNNYMLRSNFPLRLFSLLLFVRILKLVCCFRRPTAYVVENALLK